MRFAFKCRFKGVLVDWFVFMTATNIWHIPRILLSGSKGCASSSFFEDWLVSLAVHFTVRRKKIFFPFMDPVEWHIRRRRDLLLRYQRLFIVMLIVRTLFFHITFTNTMTLGGRGKQVVLATLQLFFYLTIYRTSPWVITMFWLVID